MSISWPLEREKDRRALAKMTPGQRLHLWMAEWGGLAVCSILLAVLASLTSVLSSWLAASREGFCRDHWYFGKRVCDNWFQWASSYGWVPYLLLSALFATTAAVAVAIISPGAAMSGIVELKSYTQGFDVPALWGWRPLLVKLVGIGLVTASGLWLGQEAPLVHVAAMLTQAFAKELPVSDARRRDLVTAAMAAGISVAFSAPLGGVLFVIELFTPSLAVIWQGFVCSMIASIVLRLLVAPSNALGGIVVPETGLFRVNYDRVWQGVELIPFAFLGVVGGLYGAVASRVSSWNRLSRLYASYPVASTLALVSVTALASYASSVSRMPATDLLAELFAECRESSTEMLCQNTHVGSLVYTFLLGTLLMPLTFTLPVPSGILFPTIVLGALGGRLLGLIMQKVLERLPAILSTSFCPDEADHCITPGVYALVGAGVFLTGVTRLTVSSVVLVFEITGALSFVVPIMVGVIISKWVGDTLGERRNIYTLWQDQRHLPSLPEPTATIAELYAQEIMTPADAVISIKRGEQHPEGLPARSVPVLGDSGELLDFVISRTGKTEPFVVLSSKSSLHLVVSTMRKMGVRVVLFCLRGKFKGLLTVTDVIRELNEDQRVRRVTRSNVSEFELQSDSEL